MKIHNKILLIIPLIIGLGLVGNSNGMRIKEKLSTWDPATRHPYAQPITTDKGNGYTWKIRETYRIWGIGVYTEKVLYQQVRGSYNYPYPPEELERSDFTLCKKIKALLGGAALLTAGGLWYWWKHKN